MDVMPVLPDAVRDCHPVDDVTQVPWPDFHGCPYRPYGRFGYWLVFEEPHEERGRARKRVFLTVKQVRDGALDDIGINYGLLEAWFPKRGFGDRSVGGIDLRKVADWVFFHANNAEAARLNRYEARLRAAGRWPELPAQACAKAAAERQAVTVTVPPPTYAGHPTRHFEPHVRTLHADPRPDGGALLAIRISPAAGDDFALKVRLTAEQCADLARALASR